MSGRLNLCGWRRFNRKFELDPVSGRFRIIRQRQDEYQFDGFAALEPVLGRFRRFYAVYAHDDKIWFRAGDDCWNVTTAVIECGFSLKLLNSVSRLAVSVDGMEIHSATLFHPGRALLGLADPTYDHLDLESDHFFVFLAEHLPQQSWRKWVLDGCRPWSPSKDTHNSPGP